jgi:nucleotide-binding universal stress UspA family protein
MTRIDQFESVFKSADKPVFRYEPFSVGSPMVLTDLDDEAAESFAGLAGKYTGAGGSREISTQRVIKGADFSTIEECLELIAVGKPDLICTYRGLHSDCWRWGQSLGSYVEVLTQTVSVPVLVFPHPAAAETLSAAEAGCRHVMAMTDHLAGESCLVNAALFFTPAQGTLHLTNLEDQQVFERYMEAIDKIPTIDSAAARDSVLAQILKEARDYIQSCRTVVEEQGLDVEIQETVDLGLHVADYKRLAAARDVDLLVMNTKDSGQLAMHGLAYELAVELNDIPLLLL